MEKWKLYGLIAVFVCGLIFAPVAACHDWKISKTGLGDICVGKESEFAYSITAKVTDGKDQHVKITDTLPAGVDFVSASDGGTQTSPGIVEWNFVVDHNGEWSKTVTVNVKTTPGSVQTLTNVATFSQGTWHNGYWEYVRGTPCRWVWHAGWYTWNIQARTSFETKADICHNTPEFPTMAFPAVALIGMVLITGYLKRKDL